MAAASSRREPRSERGGAGGEEEEAVAAALVHLVLRGRDIGLPRSTLPVRYSFPLLLCIIHGYPAYVRVHPPSSRAFSSFFPIAPTLPLLYFDRTVLCSPLLHPSGFLSIYIYIYMYKSKVKVHLPPSISLHLHSLPALLQVEEEKHA